MGQKKILTDEKYNPLNYIASNHIKNRSKK